VIVKLREAQASEVLELTDLQAEALRTESEKFRIQVETDEVEESKADRPALELDYVAPGKYRVRAGNFVGVVVAGDITVMIQPKISIRHFAEIAAYSFDIPSSGRQSVELRDEDAFQVLVARWFLETVRHLIPNLLISDYMEVRDQLPTKRGRVHYLPTYRLWLRGQFVVDATFEEFSLDHALNRLLRRGLQLAAAIRNLGADDRKLALRLLAAMAGVGEMRPSDLRVGTDRRSQHYGTPLQLARCLIFGRGRAIDVGGRQSQTFLIPTPSLIETGLRNMLSEHIRECERKPRYQMIYPLGDAKPDLIFRSSNFTKVGDVKYKLFDGWGDMRADLYQSVFFAAAYRTHESVILGFTTRKDLELSHVEVGEHRVTAILWDASDETDPGRSASQVVKKVSDWLSIEGRISVERTED
jgi:5-methylcytosine-specific restriction enzyme subunit McrC